MPCTEFLTLRIFLDYDKNLLSEEHGYANAKLCHCSFISHGPSIHTHHFSKVNHSSPRPRHTIMHTFYIRFMLFLSWEYFLTQTIEISSLSQVQSSYSLEVFYHPFKFSLSSNHTQLYTHMTVWRLLMITHISVFLLHKRITFPCPLYKQAGPRDKFWLIDSIWR